MCLTLPNRASPGEGDLGIGLRAGNGSFKTMPQGQACRDGAGQGAARAMKRPWQTRPSPGERRFVAPVELVHDGIPRGMSAREQHRSAAQFKHCLGEFSATGLRRVEIKQPTGLGQIGCRERGPREQFGAQQFEDTGISQVLPRA